MIKTTEANQQIEIYSGNGKIIHTGTRTVYDITKRKGIKFGRTTLYGMRYTIKLTDANIWTAKVNLDMINRIKRIKGEE